ncbi:hypothetical protein SLT36_19050 [Aminobacter sp. BA135]|uniref:hypothetical protein n=1 Tax=Aminobacter sp. BA135 TaxID=537596 RepID=UPI003D78F3AC
MVFRIMAGAAILLTFVSGASAATFASWKEKNQTVREVYVSGLGEGMSWANVSANSDLGKSLYCLPPRLGLSGRNYISILEDYAERYKSAGSYDQEVALLLLSALQEMFPCKD